MPTCKFYLELTGVRVSTAINFKEFSDSSVISFIGKVWNTDDERILGERVEIGFEMIDSKHPSNGVAYIAKNFGTVVLEDYPECPTPAMSAHLKVGRSHFEVLSTVSALVAQGKRALADVVLEIKDDVIVSNRGSSFIFSRDINYANGLSSIEVKSFKVTAFTPPDQTSP